MNAGAAAAPAVRQRGDAAAPPPPAALLFVHADTRLPPDAVTLVRDALSARRVVGGGFVSLIETRGRTWWGQSLHNVAKTFYLPLLLRPRSYFAGLRVLFGDQCIFVRTDAFRAVGGFDEAVPIMEDADLCLKLHAAGPPGQLPGSPPATPSTLPGRFLRPPPLFSRPRGRLVQLNRSVNTDGRRFLVWGNERAVLTHFAVGIAWYAGCTKSQMIEVYDWLYGDIRARINSLQ